jgi:hypothetical protein
VGGTGGEPGNAGGAGGLGATGGASGATGTAGTLGSSNGVSEPSDIPGLDLNENEGGCACATPVAPRYGLPGTLLGLGLATLMMRRRRTLGRRGRN